MQELVKNSTRGVWFLKVDKENLTVHAVGTCRMEKTIDQVRNEIHYVVRDSIRSVVHESFRNVVHDPVFRYWNAVWDVVHNRPKNQKVLREVL